MNASTNPKLHLAFDVVDLDAATQFYGTLLAAQPTKRRADYAQFDLDAPAVVLTLNLADRAGLSHLGVRVGPDAVEGAQRRLAAAGLASAPERDVSCCYAVQDKVWVTDPAGHPWEVYTVKDAAEHMRDPEAPCCPAEGRAP